MTFGPIANCDVASADGTPILQADLGTQAFDLTDGFSCGFEPTNVLLKDIFFTAGAPPPPESCVFTPQGVSPVTHGVGLFSLAVASRTVSISASSPIWAIFIIIQVRLDPFSETNVTIQNSLGQNGVFKTDLVTPATWNLQTNGTNIFVNGVMQAGLIGTLTTVFLTPVGGGSFDWTNIFTQGINLVQTNVSGTPTLDLFGFGEGVYYGLGAETVGVFVENPTDPPTEYDETQMMQGGITMGGVYSGYLSKDISGIYTLVANKRNDTVYVRAGSTLTQDVQIPNPFAEFGFTECDDE